MLRVRQGGGAAAPSQAPRDGLTEAPGATLGAVWGAELTLPREAG